jgi:hypothetical protein
LQGSHRDWRFTDSGYACLPGSNGQRDRRGTARRAPTSGVWDKEAEAHCAGSRSGPAFLWDVMIDPGQVKASLTASYFSMIRIGKPKEATCRACSSAAARFENVPIWTR